MAIARQDVGVIVVTLITCVLLWAFFRFTKLGLAHAGRRARPGAEPAARRAGGWMFALGWGFAVGLGAVSGMMVAPSLFLSPTMMQAS